jgi:GNAT superfamily N-acetyltransferase
VAQIYAGDGWPGPLCGGVLEVWPHLIQALRRAGYHHDSGRAEAMFGGRLDEVPEPGQPPVVGLEVGREVGRFGVNFVARRQGQRLGWCECTADLAQGGELPALRGWAELNELWVEADWRNRGLGAWLVGYAAIYLRLAGCDRIVLAVDGQDEAAGAGRFYQRLGWEVLTRYHTGWKRSP